MRLINTDTLQLKEFVGANIPPYAILSHTWGDEEISLQELEHWLANRESDELKIQEKEGFKKISNFCREARNHCLIHTQPSQDAWIRPKLRTSQPISGALRHNSGLEQPRFNGKRVQAFEWAWVDTCCIDKTSSAELSEAINSMYAWYARSAMCIAYLADVRDIGDSREFLVTKSSFQNSRWFTRGWTLQELLAPLQLYFYTQTWTVLGDKGSLSGIISQTTGIKQSILIGSDSLSSCSNAQKMSWAAGRRTTRVEDRAYCLLGLFDINMPLLYGEGGKSFFRLQEEIMKSSRDHSLLAWESSRPPPGQEGKATAWSVDNFEKSVRFSEQPWNQRLSRTGLSSKLRIFDQQLHEPLRWTISGSELIVSLPLIPASASGRNHPKDCDQSCSLAVLDVTADETNQNLVAIFIRPLPSGSWAREHQSLTVIISQKDVLKALRLRRFMRKNFTRLRLEVGSVSDIESYYGVKGGYIGPTYDYRTGIYPEEAYLYDPP